MSEAYKIAAQSGLRFPSKRGGDGLTVEQLFQLPLKSSSGFDLDNVAKAINTELKSLGEESFVDDASDSPRKRVLTISLDIVKDVIKTKQDEKKAQDARAVKAADRKKILDAIAKKRDAAIDAKTLEELEKQLAELD